MRWSCCSEAQPLALGSGHFMVPVFSEMWYGRRVVGFRCIPARRSRGDNFFAVDGANRDLWDLDRSCFFAWDAVVASPGHRRCPEVFFPASSVFSVKQDRVGAAPQCMKICVSDVACRDEDRLSCSQYVSRSRSRGLGISRVRGVNRLLGVQLETERHLLPTPSNRCYQRLPCRREQASIVAGLGTMDGRQQTRWARMKAGGNRSR